MIASVRTAPARPSRPKDITPKELAKGIVGLVPGAVIDSVGITGTVLAHTPRAFVDSYRALYYAKDVGPLTKGLIGTLIPVAFGVGIPLAALAAFGYGAATGAYDAAEKGFKTDVKNRLDDVRHVNSWTHDSVKGLEDEIRQSQQQPAPPPPTPAPAPAP
ncbi:MAG: hypothetical protein ACYCW6_02880 [Candidatus Xenobia bacterium]